jgi:hypothetical protein
MTGTWLLVTGGRAYRLTAADLCWLDELDERHDFDLLVHGGAAGADTDVADWFTERRQRQLRPTAVLEVEPAWWAQDGSLRRQAGPQRNAAMVGLVSMSNKFTVICAVFPGGAGTESCMRLAYTAGLRVLESPSRQAARDGKMQRVGSE